MVSSISSFNQQLLLVHPQLSQNVDNNVFEDLISVANDFGLTVGKPEEEADKVSATSNSNNSYDPADSNFDCRVSIEESIDYINLLSQERTKIDASFQNCDYFNNRNSSQEKNLTDNAMLFKKAVEKYSFAQMSIQDNKEDGYIFSA